MDSGLDEKTRVVLQEEKFIEMENRLAKRMENYFKMFLDHKTSQQGKKFKEGQR
jgi:hypothetical protein